MQAKETLSKTHALYEAGAASQQELDDAEYQLSKLEIQYDYLKQAIDDALAKNAAAAVDNATDRQRQINEYEYQLESFARDLGSRTLDLNASIKREADIEKKLDAQIVDYRETIADYENNEVIYAPEDAFVLSVAANKGQYVDEHQQLVSFGLQTGLVVDCAVNLNNNFTVVGDTCALDNASHAIEGVVTRVVPEEQSKTITVAIPSDGAMAGESFDITFEKTSEEAHILVPNGAVNMDGSGYFLSQIKRRDGILGEEFYTEKLRVYIGDSDSENTVITEGMTFFEPVALVSDKPFSDEETIKLKNEGDFFVE